MAQSNKPVPSAEQQRIIDADADANVIVVAGAGSGKTFTMTERVIHLIHEGVPRSIFWVSLSRTRPPPSCFLECRRRCSTMRVNVRRREGPTLHGSPS